MTAAPTPRKRSSRSCWRADKRKNAEHTQGLRQMLVDNYSVFYIVGEDAVSVACVLYSASDLVRRLRRMK